MRQLKQRKILQFKLKFRYIKSPFKTLLVRGENFEDFPVSYSTIRDLLMKDESNKKCGHITTCCEEREISFDFQIAYNLSGTS